MEAKGARRRRRGGVARYAGSEDCESRRRHGLCSRVGFFKLPNHEDPAQKLQQLLDQAIVVWGLFGIAPKEDVVKDVMEVKGKLLVTAAECILLPLFDAPGLEAFTPDERERKTRAARALCGGAIPFKRVFAPILARARAALKGE